VASSLKAAGIDPNAKAGTDDAERVNAFGRAVDQEGQLFEDQHKRKPNAKELQGIVDNLLVQGTIAGSGWFGTNFWADQKREFERTPGEGDFILDAKDVPAGERAKIEDTLKRNKVPVTPPTC
jgi:soluble lytic murein transglycosylase